MFTFLPTKFWEAGLVFEPSVKLKEPSPSRPSPAEWTGLFVLTVRALRAVQLFINILDPALVTSYS